MFTTGCLAMCLLFFVPYVVYHAGTLVLWFLPMACILPFALMPLFYMLIHRMDTLLFGRYHFIMPVAGFVSALFFVIAWSAGEAGAASTLAAFFGFTVFLTSVLLYRYCSFSVRARLLDENITASSPYGFLLSALGGAAAVATLVGFMHYDPQTAFLNSAYVLGGVCALLALIQYLFTYYNIPRLGGKRLQSVKNVFRTFYSGLDKRMFSSALLFNSAFAVLTVTVAFMMFYLLGIDRLVYILGVSGALILAYATAAGICIRKVDRRSKWLSVVCLSVFSIAAVLIIISACVRMPLYAVFTCLVLAAAFTGIGGAVSVRQTKLRFLAVKSRITSGAVFILLELTASAAGAIALLQAAVMSVAVYATNIVEVFSVGGGVASVLCLAAFILARKKQSKVDKGPGLTYELETTELGGGVKESVNEA